MSVLRRSMMRSGTSLDYENLFFSLIDRSISVDLIIPEGKITSIGAEAFDQCGHLNSITLPNSVTELKAYAFANCVNLKYIILGNNITSIGNWCFAQCRKLEYIIINTTTPPTLAATGALTNTNNCPIYVPDASVATYKAANNWSSLASRIFSINDM